MQDADPFSRKQGVPDRIEEAERLPEPRVATGACFPDARGRSRGMYIGIGTLIVIIILLLILL